MNDRVPEERLGSSRLNYVFVKIYQYDPKVLQELEINSGKTSIQSKEIFHKLRKCEIKELKYNSTLQFKCDNFILGCTVGFDFSSNPQSKRKGRTGI